MTKNIIVLRNAVQVALFNTILVKEIVGEKGRWHTASPKGHFLPFESAAARVAEGDEPLGLRFDARKKNYNFNDSNWVNQGPVTKKLLAVAKAASGKDMAKKAVAAELEDIKEILKASDWEEPEVSSTEPNAADTSIAPEALQA